MVFQSSGSLLFRRRSGNTLASILSKVLIPMCVQAIVFRGYQRRPRKVICHVGIHVMIEVPLSRYFGLGKALGMTEIVLREYNLDENPS